MNWFIIGWILTQLETPVVIWTLFWVLVVFDIVAFVLKVVSER